MLEIFHTYLLSATARFKEAAVVFAFYVIEKAKS